MERIGGETMVLLADLRERLQLVESMRTVASLPGEFTNKTVKGMVYHYFQATLPGGRAQIYIGPDSDEIRRLLATRKAGAKDVAADAAMLQRLAAQIIAGGVEPVRPDTAKVIHRLADSGVFQVGGVLVGTVAFQLLGIQLGVHWAGNSRSTQDIDVASATNIALAVPGLQADVPAALDSLRMGFFPVPRLSHKEPSTSFAIRGKTLRVDLLTAARGGKMTPVFIPRLNAAAAPLKYLDYLMESPNPAVMLAGYPCLVRVPQPARYALHKLIVSQERAVTAADKKRKDLLQARLLIELLLEDRPGDLALAWENLVSRGDSWKRKAVAACNEGGIVLPG
ncbi:MAG: GSU2403 family nucleotidyltransferase fold protein [Desulfuromonadales bacterium]